MRALSPFLSLVAIACAAAPASAAELHFPDRARRAIVDEAHVFNAVQSADLDRRILAYVAATHHQLVVATMPTLQGDDVKDFANRLLRAWRLGGNRANDGVLLLLSREPRQVRIEVGYGLEPVLTDALTSSILRTRIVPLLKQGNFAGGLSAGADAIIAATGGAPEQQAPSALFQSGTVRARFPADAVAAQRKRASDLHKVLAIFGAVGAFFLALFGLFLLLLRRDRRRARMIGPRRPAAAVGWSSAASDATSSSASSSSADSGGFDSGGGSSGGGGADSSY